VARDVKLDTMRNLLPIGRFSEVCRLSIPALRHYDELGLLPPASVDPDTGYRYYSISQAADADRIRTLRLLDMPLPEIKAILAADPGRIRALLEGHRRRLADQVERGRYAMSLLDSMLHEGPAPAYEIRLHEVRVEEVASVRSSCTWETLGPCVATAIGEVAAVAIEQGIRITGPAYTIYHNATTAEDELDLEVGLPTDEAVEPAGRVVPGTLPGGLMATTMHCGPYEEIAAAYRALGEWLAERGHETAGPPREIYLVTPDRVADAAALRTEVAWPIR
jgi:effector-binding domain-containing protein/DNA-binding transcriptional MerR regulator